MKRAGGAGGEFWKLLNHPTTMQREMFSCLRLCLIFLNLINHQ
jgi:hypothetical protein